MKVSEVTYIGEYKIGLTFEDGVTGSVDLTDLVNCGIFEILKDKAKFAKIYSTEYSVAWSEDLEIDAAELYAEISGKSPQEFFESKTIYASN
jgi:hypothetical protein